METIRYYMNDVELGCSLEVYSRHILGMKENLSEEALADTDIIARYRQSNQLVNSDQRHLIRIELQDFRAAKLYLMERMKYLYHPN